MSGAEAVFGAVGRPRRPTSPIPLRRFGFAA